MPPLCLLGRVAGEPPELLRPAILVLRGFALRIEPALSQRDPGALAVRLEGDRDQRRRPRGGVGPFPGEAEDDSLPAGDLAEHPAEPEVLALGRAHLEAER